MQQSGKAIILNGIGGMGKSELLNYWLKKNGKLHYDSILYFHCGDGVLPALLARQTLLMNELGLTPEQFNDPNIIDCVCDALMPYKKLLLVLDNLPWAEPAYQENVNLFAKFLSVSNAHIIATSRRDYPQYESIPIGKLKDDKAIELFKNHHKNANASDEAIREIIQRVGGHTLMIELLAKTASEYDWSAEALLEKLKDKDFDYRLLETNKTSVEYTKDNDNREETLQHALLQLFDLSLFGDNPDNQEYRDILFHLSCLASQPFTSKAVTKWLAVDTPSIKKLVKLGWIQAKDSEQYYLHESITHAVKSRFYELPSDERLDSMLSVSARMEGNYYNQDHRTLDTACLPAIASYLEVQIAASVDTIRTKKKVTAVRRWNIFTTFCLEKGLYALCLTSQQKQVEIITKLLCKDSLESASSLNNLAALHEKMGDYETALSLYHKSSVIRKKQLGDNHPEYACSLNGLAALHVKMGNNKAAFPLYCQATEIFKDNLGTMHPFYAQNLHNFSYLYKNMGNYKEALSLSLQALEIRKEQLGKNNHYYATSLNVIASLYKDMGNYEFALPLYIQSTEILKNTLGENSLDYATSLNNLALLHEKMGNYKDALPLYQQSLVINKEQLGDKHPYYVTNLHNLASLHKKMGDYQTSLNLFKMCLRISKNNLGNKHPDYASSLNNLALLHESMGNYSEALPLYEQAITIAEKTLGKEHPNTQILKENYEDAKKHASDD